ncbi:flagellar basal-body rod protein FlgB [Paenibacillus sp. V4I3]|uniref:flagellar basal body rod protein FlgB n=1 Tax=unclassified Paenibacillus TaxID=185978 RepID=UPI00278A1A8B|nr:MULTISPECIES: flagellar basal body rod protein FlgB [unclassified Paenibacillus]MDQ0876448.1 flagellar basal-body rod protein FlgB [Paenibacillus sp. V4I3]MDQ0887519.1 flagellar basal-body rod protein FlgB [Paenibacillus sp. V4I9]
MSLLDKPSWNLMERSLDASTLRQKVVANNVANADTPFFKRSDVVFEELLQGQMNSSTPSIEGYRTDPRHFLIGKSTNLPNSEIKTDDSTAINNNMNNVDMDYEMSLMAKNQLKYNAMVQQMNSEFKKMRTVLGGK